MKPCQQCEKENPSSANCCMYCGAVLSEENLDETTRLQRELNDANEIINLLKLSLSTAQKQIKNQKNDNNNAELQSLQTLFNVEKLRFEKLLIERDSQNSKLKSELAIAKTQRKDSSWGWFFFALLIIVTIIAVYFYSEKESLNDRLSNLNSKNAILKYENTSTSTVNQENLTLLKDRIRKQDEELDSLRKQVPQVYRVLVSEAYCYELVGDSFKGLNTYYPDSTILNVYAIREDYGLTPGGWVKMVDLEKY